MSCIQINPDDNIAIAIKDLEAGDTFTVAGRTVEVIGPVPVYHKVAINDKGEGETILRYGVSIGVSTQAIQAGSHVHLHNMKSTYLPTYLRKGEGDCA